MSYYRTLINEGDNFNYLNDIYGGQVACYSLRKLSSTYFGNCIEVRRSSDNATLNIGFVNNIVDTVAILAFVGAGTGYVRTWYDQSGNSNDAIQTATLTKQPIICDAGVMKTWNGHPAVYFVKANQHQLQRNPIATTQPLSLFSVTKSEFSNPNLQAGGIIGSNSVAISTGYNSVHKKLGYRAGFVRPGTTAANNNAMIAYGLFNGATSELYNNTTLETTGNPGGGVMNYIDLGKDPGSNYYEGYILEAMVYNSNQSANRVAIQTQMNNFYTIY